jgi:hypothetical protein
MLQRIRDDREGISAEDAATVCRRALLVQISLEPIDLGSAKPLNRKLCKYAKPKVGRPCSEPIGIDCIHMRRLKGSPRAGCLCPLLLRGTYRVFLYQN